MPRQRKKYVSSRLTEPKHEKFIIVDFYQSSANQDEINFRKKISSHELDYICMSCLHAACQRGSDELETFFFSWVARLDGLQNLWIHILSFSVQHFVLILLDNALDVVTTQLAFVKLNIFRLNHFKDFISWDIIPSNEATTKRCVHSVVSH